MTQPIRQIKRILMQQLGTMLIVVAAYLSLENIAVAILTPFWVNLGLAITLTGGAVCFACGFWNIIDKEYPLQ